jgi:hypothetical protein
MLVAFCILLIQDQPVNDYSRWLKWIHCFVDSLSYTYAKMASFDALKSCSAKQQLMGKVCRKRSQAADSGSRKAAPAHPAGA